MICERTANLPCYSRLHLQNRLGALIACSVRRQMRWVGPWQGNPSLAERSRRPNIRIPTNFFPLSHLNTAHSFRSRKLAGPSSMNTIITSRSCAIDRPRPPVFRRRILSSTATLMKASHDASPLASTTVWTTRNCCSCWANLCRGNLGVTLEFTHHSLRPKQHNAVRLVCPRCRCLASPLRW